MTTTVKRVDLKQRGQARFYEIDGNKYPSVTSVLQVVDKPGLIQWAKNVALEKARGALRELYKLDKVAGDDFVSVLLDEARIDAIIEAARKRPDEVRDEAASYGLRLHRLVEGYLNVPDVAVECPADLWAPWQAFQTWRKESGIGIMASEQVVWSTVHGYAGTMDLQVVNTDELFGTEMTAVVDLKTSNGIWDEHKMQIAAYAHALEERTGKRVDKGIVLRLGKDKPEFEAHELSRAELNRWLNGFLGALALWKAKNGTA